MSNPLGSFGGQKLPFASYDLVVYLGGGASIFAIVLCYFNVSIINSFSPITSIGYFISAVAAIGALFVIYVIGHSISFVSSLLVEGMTYSTFGYPSRSYTELGKSERNEGGGTATHKSM